MTVDGAYRITHHARRRMAQRNIAVEEVLAALNGRRVPRGRKILHYDRHSRCGLVVQPHERVIVTVMRLTKRQAKRLKYTIRS